MTKQPTVLVTGASRGLGATIAKKFGTLGYAVIVNYFKSEVKGLAVVDAIGNRHAIAIQADVCDKQQVTSMIQKSDATI
ncbi:SDR family NAD(P)-dependent oxidoreductase [Loigolactobacillus zhaoyuanensis]|uniref:SDR family NAD(P)-dependent oxidoreductase n=1 Tax=Loigolactobacillus zhaoyuanensis TaxID=2486017 RepID=A0ABW8UC72_9LACO|nr:SDR family NAD(P)-dependent oxidoreductase [Loigolactobacillus zhaoyuanensis]